MKNIGNNMIRLATIALLLVLMLGLMVSPSAALDDITLIGTEGTWGEVNGAGSGDDPTCLEYRSAAQTGAGNQVRYGANDNNNCLSFENKSGFGFVGIETPIQFQPDTIFKLGEFTHYNNPINIPGPAFNQVELDITLNLGNPSHSETLAFNVMLDETPNDADPCPYGPTGGPCNDKVVFASSVSEDKFEVNGVEYTLMIVGFVDECTPGGTPSEQFITEEDQNSTACLYGKIIQPTIQVVKTANPTSFTTANAGLVEYTVTVTNIDGGDMEITSIVDTVNQTEMDAVWPSPNPVLAPGESITVTYTVDFAGYSIGTYDNTVTATGVYYFDDDSITVSDSDSATVYITQGGESIPGVSEWGIIAMIAAIAMSAIVIFRRKHAQEIVG